MKRINNTAKEFKCQRNNKFRKNKIRVWLISVAFCRTKKYQKQPSRRCSHKKVKKFSEFTGEQPCRSVVSIKLLCNFIEITLEVKLRHGCSSVNFLFIFRTPFPNNTSAGLLPKHFYFTITSSNRISKKS